MKSQANLKKNILDQIFDSKDNVLKLLSAFRKAHSHTTIKTKLGKIKPFSLSQDTITNPHFRLE